MEGEKKGLNSKYRRLGYAGLLLCLMCLLIAFHWISTSVPVLRTQESAVRPPRLMRVNSHGVTAFLDASPSAPQILEYELDSKNLEVHSLMERTRFLFGVMGDRYQIDRQPPEHKSLPEAWEKANAKAGISAPTIWRATSFDKKWTPQSVIYFEMPNLSSNKPILLLQRFAVGVGPQSVHVVDLESEWHELRSFPFPMAESTSISTIRIGNNRIARTREQEARRIIDLFEIASDGNVDLVTSWDIGVGLQPKSAKAVPGSSSVTFNYSRERIYSQSASENKIEERSLSGDLLSSFEVPGLDLSKQAWSFQGGYIRWLGEDFEYSYFDIETRVFFKIPPTLFGTPTPLGHGKVADRDLFIFSGFTDSFSVPQIANFYRNSGELVGSWPLNAHHAHSTIKVGNRTEILATGFEWGLSFTKHNIQDGAVLETHFPLRPWFVGINVLAASVLGWSFAWLYFAARSGGNAWLDIYLVSGVLIGIGLWRLGTTGFPFSLDRLPYDYLTGVYFGLLAVIIFKLMEAPHSEKNRLAHLCVVLPFGSLLIVYLLYARIPPREGMLAISFGPMAPAEPTILGILAVMTSMLMVVCFFLHALHSFRTQDIRSFYRLFFRFPHFSIRDLLWVIVLMALLCVTLKYSPSTLLYFTNPPWAWVIANSALTTAAMAIALVLGATQKTKTSRIGWVMTVVVLCILLGEFAFDFANGKPPPFSNPFSGGLPGRWRIGRAILTGSVVAFVFSRRFSMMRSHSWQE